MRIILAPVLAFAAVVLARAVPEHIASEHIVLEQTLAEVPAPFEEYSAITFKAANGSDVVIHVAPGVFMADDVSKLPDDVGKKFKIKKVPKLMELCTVRASQKDNGGKGTPRRDDCQVLYDFCHSYPVYFYFDNTVDLNRWAEVAFVGSCAYRTRTVHHNVVFSSGDMANFLDRSLSRKAWTDKGRMSASGEADCTIYEGDAGFAPVYWRLQQRGPLDEPAFNVGNDTFIPNNNTTIIKTRDTKREAPLIVHSFDDIPRNTSAFISGGGTAHAINATDIGISSKKDDEPKFDLTIGGPAEGPYCDAMWLSADWQESGRPLRRDCGKLLDFLKSNTARVAVFGDQYYELVPFAAHETCAVGFRPLTTDNVTFTGFDIANFIERMLLWDGAQSGSDYTVGKMGAMCGFAKETHLKHMGEFHLIYRDSNAPKGHIPRDYKEGKRDLNSAIPVPEIAEKGAMMVKSGSPEDMAATAEMAMILSNKNASLNWVDYTVTDSNGVNITAQLNANLLSTRLADNKALGTRLERHDTPLGPSKRCSGQIQLWGGAKPDSPLIADCEKLRNFMSIRRFRFQFSRDEFRSSHATLLAQVGTCRIAWWPWGQDTTVGNMDLDILLTKALKLYDPSQTRIRLWGGEHCDFSWQFGEKYRIRFYIL
ncbi:hypothetical protein COL5a_001696 [Colletotrichum fioriniae]|uniref:uncharacterized protein n=1 Tax=Colletotrichum fioriniae TaxID=710243 RepID=UPI00230057F6|nr:uncharacterized protein COL516b_002774 [Colletotrichum fioriniae]KAJ0309528.1 hypothetical protein COL516b_002774 [Colletotrichum fioriniae]KAJ0332967.1 hypothetical protein COL5a_001696 [Colletotrichum fioriniae]KAJ3946678.1 hypothetical protein N0V96_003051 [Colletotrichum fioriniae]